MIRYTRPQTFTADSLAVEVEATIQIGYPTKDEVAMVLFSVPNVGDPLPTGEAFDVSFPIEVLRAAVDAYDAEDPVIDLWQPTVSAEEEATWA